MDALLLSMRQNILSDAGKRTPWQVTFGLRERERHITFDQTLAAKHGSTTVTRTNGVKDAGPHKHLFRRKEHGSLPPGGTYHQ